MRMICVGLALFILSCAALAAKQKDACTCKCVVKSNGKYTTEEGSGKDREAAGEKLKEKLGDKTCELSPTCTGQCNSD